MHASTMVVYGVRDPCAADEIVQRGYVDGPIELLQRSRLRHLAGERSDRTRTLWPHIFDVLHAPRQRWHASDVTRIAVQRQLSWPVELVGLEILQFVSRDEAKLLGELQSGARPEVTQALAVFVADGTAKDLRHLQSRAEQSEHRAV